MLNPAISDILKPGESYYSLVIAVAKRAREIANEAEENKIILVEKPVKLAVDDFANEKCTLVEPKGIGSHIET